MKKTLVLVLIFAAALLTAGCFDYAERMELNADGSGILHQHMVLNKSALDGMMQMFGEPASDSSVSEEVDSTMKSIYSREDIESRIANLKGVKLIDFVETQNDSESIFDIKYSFTTLDEIMKVTSDMNGGGGEMMEGMAPKKEASFVKEKSGNWKFTRDFSDSSMDNMFGAPAEPVADTETSDSLAAEDPMADMAKMMQAMMLQAFGNHSVKLTVKFPGTITESNATKVEGSEATWEYRFVDLGKAPRNIEAVIKP